MAALGSDAKPLAIQAYLKKNFKIAMSTTVISSYKTTIANQAKKKRGATGGRKPASAQAAATRTGEGISLEDIAAVKRLCDRMGAEKVRQLAQVLG
jgi:hypothetical protein